MDDRPLNEVVGDRIADVVAGEGEMVTKWLAIVEVVDTDGTRALRLMTNDGAKAWDNLGLLTYAVQYEQALLVRDEA